MKKLAKMLALVADKFKDRLDKQGVPYFLHCLYVMRHCKLYDEDSMCIALGHDLLEDTDVTFLDLVVEFGEKIAKGIQTLTHVDGEDYQDYIKGIALSELRDIVVPIKKADLEHNTQASRLPALTKKDFDRLEKYYIAHTYLKKL